MHGLLISTEFFLYIRLNFDPIIHMYSRNVSYGFF